MLAEGRFRLLLLPLLLLPHNSRSMDGCKGVFGTTNWRCGDICTSKGQDCTCGSTTFAHNDGKWCCGTNCTGGSCLKWKEDPEGNPWYCLKRSPVICTTGIALLLNESCNGDCNYYREDEQRNYHSSRAHAAACTKTSSCVKEGEGFTEGNYWGDFTNTPTICSGNSSCEGELDWCRKEERRTETCPEGFVRCLRRTEQ